MDEVSILGLRFIFGRAGTGKTHYILNSVKEEASLNPLGLPVFLLVPEQATFQTEYGLSAKIGLGGSIRAQVLSFRRLAHRIFLETGGSARIPIGELGKRMVLRELLERQKSNLRIFGKSAGRPGFADCLARSIGEMKTYLVTPDALTKASLTLTGNYGLLQDKLSDLALLYSELENYLAPRYTDPDDYLKLLAERVLDAPSCKNAEFWIDGFNGFTPQELAVIEKLLLTAKNVNVALCLDYPCPESGFTEEDLFYPTWDTFRELTRIAEKTRSSIHEPVNLNCERPYRFQNYPEIGHLEQNYYRYPVHLFNGEHQNIVLAAGTNRRAEVEACARKIIRLAMDEGYRWRDTAVVLRDLDSYYEIISEVFRDFDIPFFIDRKRPVMHHPLVELIRSAVETVMKGWTYEPVFRYLKTDLTPITREKVFLLENYVLAHGIRGSKWTDGFDWTYRRRYTLNEEAEISDREETELNEVNEARREAAAQLAGFDRKIRDSRDVREMARALFELLEDLGVVAKIDDWRLAAENNAQLDKAREHAQIWSGVVNLLDEVVEALGDEELTLREFAGILDAGFESMALGLIPPGFDQVIVASLDRSRNPEVKAVFLLGVSEGVLPAKITDDGIFNDREREGLNSLGLNLSPDSRQRAFNEQFLVYTALTRASDKLWVSYPMADDEGRAVPPSPVTVRIKELFPDLRETIFQVEPVTGDENDSLEFLVRPGRALIYLTGRLREAKAGRTLDPVWQDVYNWFLQEGRRQTAGTVLQSIFYDNDEKPLTPKTSRSLHGSPLKASVSRIERFMACPFAYFSSYGLRLKERPVFRLAAPDMGEFFHAALKSFADELHKSGADWGSLSSKDCIELTGKIVEELAPQLQSEILLSTARYRYLTGKLKRNVSRAVIVLGEHARRSDFRPVGLELSFGPDGQLPALVIDLPDGESLCLAGRIDRLDIAKTDTGTYLRVIDYKSSDNRLKPEDIYYGLKLQLLAYLHVTLLAYASSLGRSVKPGGILYFTVKEPIVNTNGPLSKEEADRAVLAELKMRGLILADPQVFKTMDRHIQTGYSELFSVGLKNDGSFYRSSPVIEETQFEILRSHLEMLLKRAGKRILDGDVAISPYRRKKSSACQFCTFKPVCKFDTLLAGNTHRVLPAVPRAEVWDLMREGRKDIEQPQLD